MRAGVAQTELKSPRQASLQNDLQSVVQTCSRRNIAPIDVLVLRKAPEGLGHISFEGCIRQPDYALADIVYRNRAVAVCVQDSFAQGQDGWIIHIGRQPHTLPVV